jgi:hypothetical protein
VGSHQKEIENLRLQLRVAPAPRTASEAEGFPGQLGPVGPNAASETAGFASQLGPVGPNAASETAGFAS